MSDATRYIESYILLPDGDVTEEEAFRIAEDQYLPALKARLGATGAYVRNDFGMGHAREFLDTPEDERPVPVTATSDFYVYWLEWGRVND